MAPEQAERKFDFSRSKFTIFLTSLSPLELLVNNLVSLLTILLSDLITLFASFFFAVIDRRKSLNEPRVSLNEPSI